MEISHLVQGTEHQPGQRSVPRAVCVLTSLGGVSLRGPQPRWAQAGGAQPPAGLPGKSDSAPPSLMVADSALMVAVKAPASSRLCWCLCIDVGVPTPDLCWRGAESQPSPSHVYIPRGGGQMLLLEGVYLL